MVSRRALSLLVFCLPTSRESKYLCRRADQRTTRRFKLGRISGADRYCKAADAVVAARSVSPYLRACVRAKPKRSSSEALTGLSRTPTDWALSTRGEGLL